MHIIDNNDDRIEITDLQKAIAQAKMFKDFRHTDASYRKIDKRLRKYWSNIYRKLLQLQQAESCRP